MTAHKIPLIALLFLYPNGLSPDELCAQLTISQEQLDSLANKHNTELQQFGLVILQHKTRWKLVVLPEVKTSLPHLKIKPETLGSAALEVLAIIAYKQPVTQDTIEQVRGVGSEQSLKTLLEKELITKRVIKKSGITQVQYSTTLRFLQTTGIKNLTELPNLQT